MTGDLDPVVRRLIRQCVHYVYAAGRMRRAGDLERARECMRNARGLCAMAERYIKDGS